jgi:hypothetical protein
MDKEIKVEMAEATIEVGVVAEVLALQEVVLAVISVEMEEQV